MSQTIRETEPVQRDPRLIFVDTRDAAIGPTHSPCFEKVVSAAASLGVLLLRYGFSLKLATVLFIKVASTPQTIGFSGE